MARYKKPYTLYSRPGKDGKKRYWYYRTYTPAGVRTHGIATGCTSKSAAVRFCDDLLARGALYSGSAQTFGEYAGHFFDDDGVYVRDKRAAGKLAPSTLKVYRFFCERYFLPILGSVRLDALNYSRLLAFRSDLVDQGTATGSINNIMAVLHTVIKHAVRDGLMARDPFDGLEQLAVTATTRDALTLDEVRKLYDEIDERARLYVAFLACSGMRANEARGVRFQDVKTSPQGVPFVRLEVQRLGDELRPVKTKDARIVPLHPALVALLPRDGFCFPHSYGVYSHASYNVLRGFDNGPARKLCLHSLRHFFVTSSKAAGVSPVKVEAVAGHKPVMKMSAVYTNFSADDLSELMQWQAETLAELGILE